MKCCTVCGKSFAKRTPAVLTFQKLHVSVSVQVVVAWWRRESWQLKQVFNKWLKCVFTFLLECINPTMHIWQSLCGTAQGPGLCSLQEGQEPWTLLQHDLHTLGFAGCRIASICCVSQHPNGVYLQGGGVLSKERNRSFNNAVVSL